MRLNNPSIALSKRIPTPRTLFSRDSKVTGRPTHSRSCHRPFTPITNRIRNTADRYTLWLQVSRCNCTVKVTTADTLFDSFLLELMPSKVFSKNNPGKQKAIRDNKGIRCPPCWKLSRIRFARSAADKLIRSHALINFLVFNKFIYETRNIYGNLNK